MIKLLLALLRWKARHSPEKVSTVTGIRSLVIVELTRLGDCITMLPVVRTFRRQFPDANIRVIVDVDHAFLSKLVGGEIEVSGIRDSGILRGFIRAMIAAHRGHPDLACSMSPSNRNAAVALLSGAPVIAGYLKSTRSYTPFLEVNPVELIGLPQDKGLTYAGENIAQRGWKVLEILGMEVGGEAGGGIQNSALDDSMEEKLRSRGFMNGRHYIVMHPFSRWEYRSWPIGEFASLTTLILEGTTHDVVFICHAREHDQLKSLTERLQGESRVRFFPSTDLLETASLMRGADLFVGNDSGPIHLAASLNIPVVGLYGPATPALAAPLHARGTFLYHAVHCSPCAQRVCVMPENHCMRLITPGEVFSAIMKELTVLATSGIPANA